MKLSVTKLRTLGLCLPVGILAGFAASAFLYLLQWATQLRETYPDIVYGLPAAGLLIGWIYRDYGHATAPGNNLIIDEIHDPKKKVPLRMAPLILGSTVLTHLFGGSAGREGTAVQMGAALADGLARFFKKVDRRALLRAGAGAGFGAAIGAPWAGALFGMEMLYAGRFQLEGWLEGLIASFTALVTTWILAAPHTHYPHLTLIWNNPYWLLACGAGGIAFGLTARTFVHFTHLVENVLVRIVPRSEFRPMVAGILLVILFKLEGTDRYMGLGLPIIQHALTEPVSLALPVLKAVFTALTIGSGFKGGEFIPLVYIGTTLGSSMANLLMPNAQQVLAGVGFAAVFGAAANTPLTCAIMACEIFGLNLAPYAFVGCFVAYLVSGRKGIYHAQKDNKRDWLIRTFITPKAVSKKALARRKK